MVSAGVCAAELQRLLGKDELVVSRQSQPIFGVLVHDDQLPAAAEQIIDVDSWNGWRNIRVTRLLLVH